MMLSMMAFLSKSWTVARVNNVRFNPNKLQFRVPKVTYVGQVVSSEGLKRDPGRVKAIREYLQLQGKEVLRRFMD